MLNEIQAKEVSAIETPKDYLKNVDKKKKKKKPQWLFFFYFLTLHSGEANEILILVPK